MLLYRILMFLWPVWALSITVPKGRSDDASKYPYRNHFKAQGYHIGVHGPSWGLLAKGSNYNPVTKSTSK